MHEGFCNFNAGTLGTSMVEGRISAGVVVGDGTDIGGGASIMGTLSGGGKQIISIGERCLLGAEAGIGISLGDDCVVEAGLYVTAGTRVTLPDGKIVKALELSGANNLLFRRNSVTGAVEALPAHRLLGRPQRGAAQPQLSDTMGRAPVQPRPAHMPVGHRLAGMRDFGAGLRYLGRGQQWVLAHGRWFGFGLLPALITLVLYAAALTALGFYADDIATWATPFADDWGSTGRALPAASSRCMLWVGVLMLAVVTFAAVTLLIGEPFYEKLSERVEESEGGLPAGHRRPAAVAGAVDRVVRQRLRALPDAAVHHSAVLARLRPVHRPDRHSGAGHLRLRFLPHGGARLGRHATPGRPGARSGW